MRSGLRLCAAAVSVLLALAAPAMGAEAPKRGGTLTYMIPADAPPSFDGHQEGTFAMLHATAPFYSTLTRINPENASSTTDFVCDLCTEMPQPTDDGKTFTFKLRDGVRFHDGTPLTSAASSSGAPLHLAHPGVEPRDRAHHAAARQREGSEGVRAEARRLDRSTAQAAAGGGAVCARD